MCWSMRGGVTYEEALNLSYSERVIIGDLIKDNMETVKKTGFNDAILCTAPETVLGMSCNFKSKNKLKSVVLFKESIPEAPCFR